MERNGWFFRIFFLAFALLSALTYELSTRAAGTSAEMAIVTGIGLGALAFAIIFAFEQMVHRITMRPIKRALLGLLLGSLMGFVFIQGLKIFLGTAFSQETLEVVQLFSFLACVYLAIMLLSSERSLLLGSSQIVQGTALSQVKKKEILLELSSLEDPRLIELARTGLLDHQLVVPSFVIKEIGKSLESLDENNRLRAKKCQEHIKRLELMEHLDLQIKEFDAPEHDEMHAKLSKIAKQHQAYIMISHEVSQIRTDDEAPLMISLEAIASALKPGAQRGEILTIKIQRLGKEPKQGVGYLEDSTMVVVNGGGEFLGQTIRTQVLSQKYSSSGKIIFCNAITQDEKGNIKPNSLADVSPYHLTYQ